MLPARRAPALRLGRKRKCNEGGDTGYWIFDIGYFYSLFFIPYFLFYWMLDAGYSILDIGTLGTLNFSSL
jgi:hypothetical protein